MKIVVAGGRSKADFLIGSLLEKKHEVTVINDEEAYCRYLSEKYNIPVVVGIPASGMCWRRRKSIMRTFS